MVSSELHQTLLPHSDLSLLYQLFIFVFLTIIASELPSGAFFSEKSITVTELSKGFHLTSC